MPFWVWIAIAVFGVFIAQFRAFHKVRLQRENLTIGRATKDALGEYLSEGEALARRCFNEKELPPFEEADNWALRVEDYLKDHCGSSYIARFRSSAGLPTGFTTIASPDHNKCQSWIKSRVARLNEFIKEIDTISITG